MSHLAPVYLKEGVQGMAWVKQVCGVRVLSSQGHSLARRDDGLVLDVTECVFFAIELISGLAFHADWHAVDVLYCHGCTTRACGLTQ